jgi:hypothetical protein
MLAARCGSEAATVTSRISDLGGADPYAVLGVHPTADNDTIVAAYRRLIRQAHPDLPTGDEERAKLLHLARDILLNPISRSEYDRLAAGGGADAWDNVSETSVWDDEDVVTGPMGSPITTVPPPPRPQPAWYPVAPPYAPYTPRPVQPTSSGFTLGIAALVVAFLCSPAGLIMGVIALNRKPSPSSADRVCAWIAIAWGCAALLLCGGYFMLAVLASSTGSANSMEPFEQAIGWSR